MMIDSSDLENEKGLGTDRQNAGPNACTVVGQDLAEIANATLRLAADLRPMLDGDAVAALNKLVQEAQNDACRIAVIGQVKAGKSTLVNALIRRPCFLPSDVNPWTAVVTNMHFGRRTGTGAVYQFFNEADWQHLAAGGRLLELSQRLGIALDADTLASQVRSMREHAERRLGEQFQQLLGKQHRFASASAEVLERYVCVGDIDQEPAGRPASKLGRFADITKSADIYFELPPFAYPTTIIDTPGTNDPFLVRDAITREAFKRADAYIVVLNAQQALSSSDLDLLRLLQGLEKSRLVIFINRVDLLPNPEDGEIVVAHVRSKLAIEFPGIAIPVVAGSALLAESAVPPDEITAETPDRETGASIRRNGGTMSGDAAPGQTEVIRSSGLDDLTRILSRLVTLGSARLRLQRRQNALRDTISKMDLAARSELLSLELRISSVRGDDTARTRRQATAAEDLQHLGAVSESVAKLVQTASSDLGLAKNSATERLNSALRDIIRRHAATARETLLTQPHFSRHDHVWQYPTLQLRRDLEHSFQTTYKETAEQLRGIEQTANTGILQKIGDLLPADALLGDAPPIYIIDPEPSIGALGQTVAIELDDQWRAWWRLWHGQKQRARKLEELLIAEFNPVVEALVDAAEAELDAYVVISVERFSQLGRDLVAMLKRRSEDVEAASRNQVTARPDALQECQKRQKELEQRIQNCGRIAGKLKLVISRCAAFGTAAG
jgi:tRNA U34 5-carboxymethylaminomethyl modifying GTPase MnmE/TrmE